MAYNPYGAPPYGAPPGTFGAFPGADGMPPPPGLGPPPGMSSAPGMAPIGGQPPAATQANRPSGLPASFQPPPNINFSAPVIRLGALSTSQPAPSPTSATPTSAASAPRGGIMPGRHNHHNHHNQDSPMSAGPDRVGLGGHGMGSARHDNRPADRNLFPPTNDEKLRTVFVHKIPDSIDNAAVERILGAFGSLRRWDAASSVLEGKKGTRFGLGLYEDAESLAVAAELLDGIEVPAKAPTPTPEGSSGKDEAFDGIDKVKLLFAIDPSSQKYLDHHKESRDDDGGRRLDDAKHKLKSVLLDIFYPKTADKDGDGDVAMGGSDGNVEVVNIPLAQDDELADIPAEMREVVAAEIAAFRERSNRRDQERIRREEEMEEVERQRAGLARTHLDSPSPRGSGGVNNIPVQPRTTPLGPKAQNGRISFVNGSSDPHLTREDEDTDASDEELQRRITDKQKAEDEKQYLEAERKWVNRERSRAAALARETDREASSARDLERARQAQLEQDAAWDDEREASRKTHLYYRDHAAWLRKRMHDKADEEARDEQDRRLEEDERRREQIDLERARGMADSFLDQQAQAMVDSSAPTTTPAPVAPQPIKLSLGAAAARAQRANPQRRTIAEVEGLLDDEEAMESTKRTLVPIQFEPITGPRRATADMSDEEISAAIKALAAEIPAEKEGLWAWAVSWAHLEDNTALVTEKLRPFVEKKIMEYLGVQEEMLVDVVERHLRKRGEPGALVEELQEALDDDAEDLVKKVWRMLIFFTECEKRGLPT